MLVWHFEIHGAQNRLVKRDDTPFNRDDQALTAACKYLEENAGKLGHESLTVLVEPLGFVGGYVCPQLEILVNKYFKTRDAQTEVTDAQRSTLRSIMKEIEDHQSSGHNGKPCSGE
jgi:hypothetical protein